MTGDIAAGIQEMWLADATAQRLGVVVVEASPGQSVVRMTVGEDHVNGLAVCHGGTIFTLADIAMSYASNAHSHGNHERRAFATSAVVDFINPARVGDVLVARAIEESLRGRAGIYDVRVNQASTEGDGDLVATFRGRTLTVS